MHNVIQEHRLVFQVKGPSSAAQLFLAIITFSSESESATHRIFLPGYHPGPASLLQRGVSLTLKPANKSGEVTYSIKSSTNLIRILTSRIIFFSPFCTSCPNAFGQGFWHRHVQEIGREEHLFKWKNTLARKLRNNRNQMVGQWWSLSSTSLALDLVVEEQPWIFQGVTALMNLGCVT